MDGEVINAEKESEMRNRLQNPKNTSEAAYNYGQAIADCKDNILEALSWLDRCAADGPNKLREERKGDHEWARTLHRRLCGVWMTLKEVTE